MDLFATLVLAVLLSHILFLVSVPHSLRDVCCPPITLTDADSGNPPRGSNEEVIILANMYGAVPVYWELLQTLHMYEFISSSPRSCATVKPILEMRNLKSRINW